MIGDKNFTTSWSSVTPHLTSAFSMNLKRGNLIRMRAQLRIGESNMSEWGPVYEVRKRELRVAARKIKTGKPERISSRQRFYKSRS